MPAQSSVFDWNPPRHFNLATRMGAIGVVLMLEALIFSFIIQGTPVEAASGIAALVHDVQHWLFRFLTAYAGCLAILIGLAGGRARAALTAASRPIPVRFSWAIAHAILLVPFTILSASLYGDRLHLPFVFLAIGWHLCAAGIAITLLIAMAPLSAWRAAQREAGALPLYAVVPAAAAVLAIQASQHLWTSAARLTFGLVQMLLRPFLPGLQADTASLTVSTDRFAVTIAEVCSGLEGVGLMLVFCAGWLWYFRREYIFPRALIIIPAAALLMFFLNAVRIAALLLIGDAGYARIATVGFHSQAGWIAFNAAAFTVALVAKRSPWFNRTARSATLNAERAPAENAVAPYLMPLLAILAAGMLAHALSGGFDVLYPLRLLGGAAVLWAYRRRYGALDWRFGWRAISVGAAMFVIWTLSARLLGPSREIPDELTQMSSAARVAWVTCRIAAATLTVPIAEELAYRGYLLRRLVSADFESVRFQAVRWPALVLVSAAFGAMHGALWLPGLLVGLSYGLLLIKTGKIGESVAAHATTNALLAIYVLSFDQWQLW